MSPAPDLMFDGPASAEHTVVLAHGAGAPMDSPFMNTVASGLAGQGIRVARFEFKYMQRRRTSTSRPGPDRPAVLEARWEEVVRDLGPPERLVIGGKSLRES